MRGIKKLKKLFKIFRYHIYKRPKNLKKLYILFEIMVTRTGFEPVHACVKGMCVNRFTNGPYTMLLYYILYTMSNLNFKKYERGEIETRSAKNIKKKKKIVKMYLDK